MLQARFARLAAVLTLWAAITVVAAPPELDDLPKIKPLEPAEAVKSFQLRPGFRIELVASEPLIRSPVAMDFDENGRLFVVEFPEYNQYANPGSNERGCVKLLADTNGDGIFDKSSEYAANLDSPVAAACWDGGVFVGIVPDLWYFKDTDGDGRADVKRKVLSGFERDRAGEAMLNSFRWGPDNRFHIAAGLAGGNLHRADKEDAKAISVRRQNILFDPRTGDFEPTSGGGQHGMTLDDWGDTFTCSNSNPFEFLSYDARYVIRNPFVQAPPPLVDINAAGRYPKLHRISPPEPWREVRTRLRKDKLVPGSDEGGQPFGFFTGATGVTVYRGNAFPAEFRGDIFVGEVANNLVYRAKLEPKGLGWSAVRAETGREFLASKDVWFRPVQFANAPDGTLYVVDMYRELIEGAAFLPPQLLKLVDVAGGINRGRIYRIVPDGFEQPKLPQLAKATTAELVALLEHRNGWHRDTAARMLYQRQDRDAIAPLRKLATGSKSALGRMHALHALRGLDALTDADVVKALGDSEPRLREHALRLAEDFASSPAIRDKVAAMTGDTDLRVRCQLAFTLGAFPRDIAVSPLAKLAVQDGATEMIRFAILCSAGSHSGSLFAKLLDDASARQAKGVKESLVALAGQTAAANRADEVAAVVKAINGLPDADAALASDLVRAFVTRLPASGRAKFAGLRSGKAGAILAGLLADARKIAANEKATAAARAAAIRTLGLASFDENKSLLADCLQVQQPPAVQAAALAVLARYDSADVPRIILAAWPAMSPQIRASAAETLLARADWIQTFLDAVEKGVVRPTDLDPARVQVLQKSSDAKVRERAAKLFAGAGPSKRQDVLAQYQKSLAIRGDAAKGKIIFKNVCSACHRLEGVGEAIGPDLASIKNRGAEAVMTNVLDPNREVLPQYFTYVVTTDADVTVTGMITAESANTITIRKADKTSEAIQRVNIASLRSSGLSAMPEGLEKEVSPEAMADLLAYLDSIK